MKQLNTLKKSLETIDKEEMKRALLSKYYNNSIILKNNTIIDLTRYNLKHANATSYSLNLPRKNNIYYYNNSFNNKYYFLEGSKFIVERDYLNELEVKELSISFDKSDNLFITPYIVEYHDSEIIDILVTTENHISFQPNERTDAFEILFKLNGEGIVYNIDVSLDTRRREVFQEKNIVFSEKDFFLNKNLVDLKSTEETNELVFNVQPNDRKHIYISYLETNNKYSVQPTYEILRELDILSNLFVELNILKDQTLEILPMLIEYNQSGKIGIKNLNIINAEIIRLNPETTNVRLAFRISGYGEMKIKNFRVMTLESLPENHKLDFEDRTDVVKLLSPAMKLNEFKVACIMDEFTYHSFKPEVQLYRLDYNKWKSELLFIQPDLLFIESAWVGNNGKWYKKVAYYNEEQHKEIRQLIEFAKTLKIPVVFWNKEDPVHYDRFIETAKLCDYIFTTDKGRVKQYKKDCMNNNVDSLPFAAQPKNHNPIKIQKTRDARVSFAGSYYKHHEERSKDMDVLLEASREFGLVIYDRNYEKTKKGQMPNHKFPSKFEPYIEGTLPFNLIDKSYKGYKYMINVNTVKHSETMFSRRVFEGLLSGTPIISTYSLGMKKMFGNIINASNSISELREHLYKLDQDDEVYNKYSIKGIREVLLNHTYEQRMKKVLNKIGYRILSDNKSVYFIAFINDSSDIETYYSIYKSQKIECKKLVLVHRNINNYKDFYNNYNTADVIGIDYNALHKYTNIKQLLGEGFIAVLNKKHFYAENYSLDLLLANLYSQADVIGKAMYYSHKNNSLDLINKDEDFIYTNKLIVDRSIINVSVFDKFTMDNTLQYLENTLELENLSPFGAKLFSNDSLNFIENGIYYDNKNKVKI